MSNNFDFDAWLKKHNELVELAQKLFVDRGLNAIITKDEKKPSYVRIFFGKKTIDFKVKEVNTRMGKSVWLCKDSDFDPDDNFLIRTRREDFWIIITGKDADREGEYKESDYQEGVKYVVAPMEIARPAKTFIKLMKARLDSQMQKRISDFS
jgi:hypothetical protein